jgi:predicted nucleic acid-binding protein
VIYLDACLVIYQVEEHPVFGPLLMKVMSRYPGDVFAVSPLVRLECLVSPLRDHNTELVQVYRDTLALYRGVPIPESAYEEAARFRAEHNLGLPDALHLATAKAAGCTALWTVDERFAKAAPDFAVDIRKIPGL